MYKLSKSLPTIYVGVHGKRRIQMRIGITERGDGGLQIEEVLSKMSTVDGAIIVTKAPSKIWEYTFNGGKLPENTVIHCTVTGFGRTWVEPGVKEWDYELGAAKMLKDLIGSERCVLRVDPLWVVGGGVRGIIGRQALVLSEGAMAAFTRLRISFLDMYPHVRQRIANAGHEDTIYFDGTHAPYEWRENVLLQIKTNLYQTASVEVCGEPDMTCSGCVSQRDIEAMGLTIDGLSGEMCGQRTACRCLAEKMELLTKRGQCAHQCIYCYWKG